MDTKALKEFFKNARIAETLRLSPEESWDWFKDSVLTGMAENVPSEEIAFQALSFLEDRAADEAMKTGDYDYDWVLPLQNDLIKIIDDLKLNN